MTKIFQLIVFVSCLGSSEFLLAWEAFVPVTQRCKDFSSVELSNLPEVDYKFHGFLSPLMENRDVVGVFELSSERQKKYDVLNSWYAISMKCHATSSMVTELPQQDLRFLRTEFGVSEILGARVSNGKLTLYFRQNDTKPAERDTH